MVWCRTCTVRFFRSLFRLFSSFPPIWVCEKWHLPAPKMMMMSWCLMSSDVIWHIRDTLWPMPKHGSIKATYVRCMRVLAVTCHLHFWQNDRDFLRATVVTRGWNGYRNKSQHRKWTLEKKILPPFQQGFEPATFQSRVRCSNHWAIPAPKSAPKIWNPFFYTWSSTAWRISLRQGSIL